MRLVPKIVGVAPKLVEVCQNNATRLQVKAEAAEDIQQRRLIHHGITASQLEMGKESIYRTH